MKTSDNQIDLLSKGYTTKNTKQCTCCNKVKELSDFHKKGERIDSRCKDCVNLLKKMKRKQKKRKVLQTKIEVYINKNINEGEFVNAINGIL